MIVKYIFFLVLNKFHLYHTMEDFFVTPENNINIIYNLSHMIVPFRKVVMTRKTDGIKIIIKSTLSPITINDVLKATPKFWNRVYDETIGEGSELTHIKLMVFMMIYYI